MKDFIETLSHLSLSLAFAMVYKAKDIFKLYGDEFETFPSCAQAVKALEKWRAEKREKIQKQTELDSDLGV